MKIENNKMKKKNGNRSQAIENNKMKKKMEIGLRHPCLHGAGADAAEPRLNHATGKHFFFQSRAVVSCRE
jgi:hypothetical protein